jgi:HK97 gp10 family phage protein
MSRRRSRTGSAKTRAVINGEAELMNRLNGMAAGLKKEITTEALKAGAEVVKREMSAKARGSTAQSIEIQFPLTTGMPKVIIGPDKDHWYAAFQEFGTRRHIIKTKVSGLSRSNAHGTLRTSLNFNQGDRYKKVLAGDGEIFGRVVNHPGTSRKPFVRPAIDDHEAEVKAAMMAVIRRRLGVT